MGRRTIVNNNGQIIDITEKRIILYGAGQGAIEYCDTLQLENIEYVVDSDRSKKDTNIQLFNRTYAIHSPDKILELNMDDYCIVISSHKYAESIKADICKLIGDRLLIIEDWNKIGYVYDCLTDMFLCDPFVQKKIVEQHASTRLKAYINKVLRIAKENIDTEQIMFFYPLKQGHRIVFILGSENKQYVCMLPGVFSELKKESGWRISATNTEVKNEIFEIKKRLINNDKLTIYEDEEGFVLQHYAGDKLEFRSKDIRKKILCQLRKVHLSDLKVTISVDVTERYTYLCKKISNGYEQFSQISNRVEQLIKNILCDMRQESKSLCHGDFHHGNIVGWKNDIFFIDWEFMCMADSMYDVCRFLYYSTIDENSIEIEKYGEAMEQLYRNIHCFLEMYYGRLPEKEEVMHARRMLLFCEAIEFCLRILREQERTRMMGELVCKHIYEYGGE